LRTSAKRFGLERKICETTDHDSGLVSDASNSSYGIVEDYDDIVKDPTFSLKSDEEPDSD
jgi:hypothetical protein